MWAHHNKNRRGAVEIKIREEEVEEDGMVVHRRYVNLTRSLDIPYSLGNIGPWKQATHAAHRGTLGQSPKELHSQKQQMLKGKLTPLEWI